MGLPDKRSLRAQALATRDLRMAAHGARVNSGVVAALRSSALYQRARVVAAYLAFRSEVDLSELLTDSGKRFVLPRTQSTPDRHLTLHDATAALTSAGGSTSKAEAWERHAFGQSEPPTDAPLVRPGEVDLFLVPGLAFDTSGARLGYGLGYYDRLLPLARADALLVGVTLDALLLAELPHEEHDVRMDYLVTETGVREALKVSSHEG